MRESTPAVDEGEIKEGRTKENTPDKIKEVHHKYYKSWAKISTYTPSAS